MRIPVALLVVFHLLACDGGTNGTEGPDLGADATADGPGAPEDAAPGDAADAVEGDADTGDTASSDAPPGSTQFVLDDEGAVLILRGMNVDNHAKGDPERSPAIDREGIARLGRWGFNVVRHLIFWDALEPEPGRIDTAYLDRIEERVGWYHDAGIHVVLDMHQDVYSRRFCCDGAPEWAIRDDGLPFDMQPLWSANYLQPAVMRAFDNFWDVDGPHGDLQDHYEAVWVAVAERFRDHPAVVGYDLINEPFPGSAFDLAEALTVDRDGWIFVEPRFGAIGNGSPCFIPQLDDPRPNGPRIVYAPHLYSTVAEAREAYSDDDGTVTAWELERVIDQERMQAPIWLGEFGTAWGWSGTPEFIEALVDMADRMGMGWAYWSWDPGGPSSWSLWDGATGEDNPMARAVARPYPRRILGAEPSWSFDQATARLVIDLEGEAAGPVEVEIFVAAASWYPDGWALTSDPPLAADATIWDADREILQVRADAAETLRLVVAPDD